MRKEFLEGNGSPIYLSPPMLFAELDEAEKVHSFTDGPVSIAPDRYPG